MTWQSGTINPATTSPAADITKITNDLSVLRSVIGGGTDTDVPMAPWGILQNNAGNIGVGTASAGAKLEVVSANQYTQILRSTDATTGAGWSMYNNTGTAGLSTLTYGSSYAAGTSYSVGVNGTVINGLGSAPLAIGTAGAYPLILGANNTEGMRIDPTNRYALVGYTTSNGAYRLQVNGQIFATSATIATSDARYKQNITELAGTLDLVQALRPVSFEWKPHEVHHFPAGRTVGFIAQEVAAALEGKAFAPAIVKASAVTLPDGTEQEFMGVAEGNLIALLVGAVKELAARVEALEAQVHA